MSHPSLQTTVPGVAWDDEAQQIAAAQRDPRQFNRLYDRYVQAVYRYLLSRLGNQQEAEDITSQTFLKALEVFPRYRHNGHFAAWLFSIARSKMVDHWRASRNVASAPDESLPGDFDDPLQQVIETERIQALRQLVMQLPEDDRELLRLRFTAELSFGEIAVLLDRSEDAVKKATYRLLARMQNQMEVSHD
jgi:RNA polymerase sigma-70 factor (ECF subfamily)